MPTSPWTKNDMSPDGRKKLAAAILSRRFPFLLMSYPMEARQLVEDFTASWKGMDAKDFSNGLQRVLYQLARVKGFRRLKNDSWTDFPPNTNRRKLLRAALRRSHLGWLWEKMPKEDLRQEEELFLLLSAQIKFVKLFFRAAGRHFYQVAVNYGFKRPRGVSWYISPEVPMSRFALPGETAEETAEYLIDRALAGVNGAFWRAIQKQTTEDEWESLWHTSTHTTISSADQELLTEVRRRVLA